MTNDVQPGPLPPIPLTIVTGFLGAGKTTLLNRLLRSPEFAGSLVIVNEFGEVGLDHLLVEAADRDTVLLAAGCLCCTVRGTLVSTLEDLLRRRDNGRIAPFVRVIVETTGLADPAPVMNAVLNHPYLRLRYRLDGIVTLVDAVNGAATIDGQMEAMRQVAVADRLILTKTDLADDPAGLMETLRHLNGVAPMVTTADATPADLIGLGPFAVTGKHPDIRAWLGTGVADAHHHHDHHHHDHHHHHGHDHDVSRHGDRIRSTVLTAAVPLPSQALDLLLEGLRELNGPKLLRLKGLVALQDDPERPVVLHAVQHVVHPPVRLEAWPDGDRTSRLVVILQDTDPSLVEKLWAAIVADHAAAASII